MKFYPKEIFTHEQITLLTSSFCGLSDRVKIKTSVIDTGLDWKLLSDRIHTVEE